MIDLKNISLGSDPKKTLKVMLSLAATFLVLWVFVLAQNNNDGGPAAGTPHGLVKVDSLHISLSPAAATIPQKESSSFFSRSLPIVVILAVVMAGLWYWQKKNPVKEDGLFTIVGKQQLGVGQQITVIFINEEYWVLSTSGKDISLMHRYSKEEWNGKSLLANKDESNRFLKIFTEKQQDYAS